MQVRRLTGSKLYSGVTGQVIFRNKCPMSDALPARFWQWSYGLGCPTVLVTCGSNLSKISLDTLTMRLRDMRLESRWPLIPSCSGKVFRQSAGSAAVVHGNYSYQNILDPSVTYRCIYCYFYSQDLSHKINDLNINEESVSVEGLHLEGDKFYLVSYRVTIMKEVVH